MFEDWQNGGFGIYIHWPFCEAKCPYCDFNSHVSRFIDQDAWRKAYLAEIDRYAEEFPGRLLNSVFFGGGTPSLMEPRTVSDILERITKHWPVANDLEVTLEANPSSVEAARFAQYRNAGINRTSLGIQALNDQDLRKLGRLHTAKEALDALDTAKSTFDRVSFDLMYARQDQSVSNWERELALALSFGTSHLSLYQLTIEDGTAFGERHARGLLQGLPDEDVSADLYELTTIMCEAAGLPAYETSNYAQSENASRHNLIYWRCGDYIGIGPGAHGRLSTPDGERWSSETALNPNVWLSGVGNNDSYETRDLLTESDRATELLLMGLRLKEGIDIQRYQLLKRNDLSSARLTELMDLGAVERDGNQLSVSPTHTAVLNAVVEHLLRD